MPHSGGGGSHGGGSHGGSHGGGSSSRTSRTYFPGARRYRRHYNDGRPDEYIYSNSRPQKTGLSGIIAMLLFAGIFSGAMFFSIRSTTPKKLSEQYDRPDSYVIDSIDVIDNEADLEDVLEEFNDMTGICPVIYTVYTEEYDRRYADLESYAYDYYVDNWSDEQHYLIVYAIPEDQADAFRSGELQVPDYYYEIMMGNDTDAIISESIEENIVSELHDRFERGESLDRVFTKTFESLIDRAESRLNNSKGVSARMFIPIVVVLLFFALPLFAMIKSYIKDKHVEIEEVPLTETDNGYASQYRSNFGGTATAAGVPQSISEMPKGTLTAIKAIMVIFLAPFIIIGIVMLIKGIAGVATGGVTGIFELIFGLIWSGVVVVILITVFSRLGKSGKSSGAPMTAEYPKAEMPHSEYPFAEYPQQEYNSTTHDDCRSSHEEDEDSIRKGYE